VEVAMTLESHPALGEVRYPTVAGLAA
jgi:hypothetical protein